MALESVSVAENLDQSKNIDDDDLEDGEIPSDEDDDEIPVVSVKPQSEPPKPLIAVKNESPKSKGLEDRFIKNRRSSQPRDLDRSGKHKQADDWAGDVEKAIKAALEEDRQKNNDKTRNNNKNNNNKGRNRKRSRDERIEERNKDLKKRRTSEEGTGGNDEDDDEMLFVRGASPVRKDLRDNSPPLKRDRDRDRDYDSSSSYEDRLNRDNNRDINRDNSRDNNRDNNRHNNKDVNDSKRNAARANRRNAQKNERSNNNSKNNSSNANAKSRAQLRNERSNRRNQVHEQNQDPDSICVYYMQGKCHRGDDCPFSHNALPPRKMELCKFYLMDCCAKRDKCLYMHQDFPCKFFHTGLKCTAAENCKFSHQPLNEQVKNILLKHLETAPKEILGNFPRLTRDGALSMINNKEKNLAHGNEAPTMKIPSLFEVHVPNPLISIQNNQKLDDDDPIGKNSKDRKQPSKKTRWGSDDDRVPYDVILQSVNQQLGLKTSPADAALQLQQQVTMNFYSENNISANNISEVLSSSEEKQKLLKESLMKTVSKDVDLRQLITAFVPPIISASDSSQDEAKPINKTDEESDNDDNDLVIEMPSEEKPKEINTVMPTETDASETSKSSQEVPSNLPKKTQELYMRIQQQQREANDSFKNLENDNDKEDLHQVNWYSDDDNDDDDDDESGHLTIVGIEDEDTTKDAEVKKEESSNFSPLLPSIIPQPAAIIDKLGDLSKIDISMEVSKLLSSIKAQSSTGNQSKQTNQSPPKPQVETTNSTSVSLTSNTPDPEPAFRSPKSDPVPGSSPPQVSAVSRDPRMSRDPRQRREEPKPASVNNVVPYKQEFYKDPRLNRLETSIYSSGIISNDGLSDADFRGKDQDHRRKDMDLRQCFSSSNFGDTDLRRIPGQYTDTALNSDVDLRQMLNLPFKPVPSHIPCTDIDASLSSHLPIPYKIHTVDIPRPDYTGLKLTRNDPQVRYDPRLRKIFRLSSDEIADSPMSPPPVSQKPDTPKSPPLIRSDPRRKALEAAHTPKVIPTTMQHVQEHSLYSQAAATIPSLVASMGHPGGNKPLLGTMPANLLTANIPSLISNGPNSHSLPQNQMNYDPRINNSSRNNGVGLLGPAPAGYGPDGRPSFDNYDRANYNGPSGFLNNYGRDAYTDDSNFGNKIGDWNSQNRMNRKNDRRRPGRGKFSN